MSVLLAGCGNDKDSMPQPEAAAARLEVPANFPALPAANPDNPLTEEGIALGRALFYDTRLSGNDQLSCASCHSQALAFTDGVALSKQGVAGTTLKRHVPGLANLAWMDGLFWDGGSKNLESLAFGPITAEDEMDQDLTLLVSELKAVPAYVKQFKLVFQDEIKTAYIARALAQFQRTLISGNSRYDKYSRRAPGAALSAGELRGLQQVRQKCGTCHAGELFTDNLYHNNGLDSDFSDSAHEGIYQGRYRITYNPADLGSYKTPTLRNVMRTAPYMHDGRFATMEEVLDHYSQGVRQSPSLDPALQENAGIPLTTEEKADIISFLETLTDHDFLENEKFGPPQD